MRDKSLLGEVALRLSSHPENVATESLLYILQNYPSAWEATRSFIKLSGIDLPESLSFRTQVPGDDGAIPDLVGTDFDGDEVLLVEAKFWAGLTPNQPCAYLRRLPDGKPGCVAIVAPSARFETLWPKLAEGCSSEGFVLQCQRDTASGLRVVEAIPAGTMALITWPALLGVLRQSAEARGETHLQSDIEQLSGLCSQMDREGFLPLQSRDTSPSIGRRVKQFADLVDTVVFTLKAAHGASTKNLSVGGSQSTYGHFFHLCDLGFFFAYNPTLWARYWETPMWLSVKEADWSETQRIRNTLINSLAAIHRPVVDTPNGSTIPIDLLFAAEQADVVSAIIQQIKDIAILCRPKMSIPATQ